MREQFLRDNRERLDEDNYEFKRRDRNDEVPITKGINDQQKKKRWRQNDLLIIIIIIIIIIIFGFEHAYFRSWHKTLMFRNYLGFAS